MLLILTKSEGLTLLQVGLEVTQQRIRMPVVSKEQELLVRKMEQPSPSLSAYLKKTRSYFILGNRITMTSNNQLLSIYYSSVRYFILGSTQQSIYKIVMIRISLIYVFHDHHFQCLLQQTWTINKCLNVSFTSRVQCRRDMSLIGMYNMYCLDTHSFTCMTDMCLMQSQCGG